MFFSSGFTAHDCLYALKLPDKNESHLLVLVGDDHLSSAIRGETVGRREASARRGWGRRFGGFFCFVSGYTEIHCTITEDCVSILFFKKAFLFVHR